MSTSSHTGEGSYGPRKSPAPRYLEDAGYQPRRQLDLVERIKAASEDGPATEPLVYKVDRQSIQHIRDIILPEYLPTEE